ncbi:MAG: type II secretion system protein [Planctomycetota bacterium]|jgi:type II secretory pathway pseudopilin PulG
MRRERAFTIVELLVVVSIIALLIGILLPAIGKARDQAKLAMSQNNLRTLGQAAQTYAAEWNDRQFTLVDDNLGRYGNSAVSALTNYEGINFDGHPGIWIGWAAGADGGNLWYFPLDGGFIGVNADLAMPIDFEGLFGWFRLPNVQAFNRYVNDRFYDPVYYAPKDRIPLEAIEDWFDSPGEWVHPNLVGSFVWPTYVFSPAACFSPDVMRAPPDGGFQDPFSLDGGLRCPSMSQARFPDLKTHMMEHHWLQQKRADCNAGFEDGTYDGCEPYYFNHSWESVPVTLFYDGHIEGLGVREAESADTRMSVQAGHGLWSRDTTAGATGYFIDVGYDFANTSFHILTTEGIRGRDKLGR